MGKERDFTNWNKMVSLALKRNGCSGGVAPIFIMAKKRVGAN